MFSHFNYVLFLTRDTLQPEWLIANCGAILGGCIAAGIYTTNTPDACKYITQHSRAEVVVVEDNKQLKKYASIASELPHLKAIVVYAEAADPALAAQTGKSVYSWADFLMLGVSVSDNDIENRQAYVKPGHCSTLIYTSGTTGPPKAVMISHDNVTWTVKNLLDNYMDVNHTERIVSYLPLSHIAAQMIDVHAPMYVGGCTYFAQPDALKGSLTATLKDVRPTLFFGVPRVWEVNFCCGKMLFLCFSFAAIFFLRKFKRKWFRLVASLQG